MNVTITSPFWKRRRDQIVESVIPYQWGVMNDEIDTTVPDDPAGNQLADNKSHAVANLKVAAGELDDEFHGMVFQDSDVYKWLEEAAYALAYHPDPELKALCDRTVDLIARAQQSDGYLDTPYQIKSGVWADRPRFSLIQQSHEMYVMGHYIEAAVAYHQVTGNEQALEVAKKMADCLDANFGPEEGKIHGADGHPEIELALAKLYEETGEKRYLTLSQYLIDVRGQDPQFYTKQLKALNGDNIFPHLLPGCRARTRPADRGRPRRARRLPVHRRGSRGPTTRRSGADRHRQAFLEEHRHPSYVCHRRDWFHPRGRVVHLRL